MQKIYFLFLALGLLCTYSVEAAELRDSGGKYSICMKLAKVNPDQAFEAAITWRDSGGGDPARHCTAMALVGLKHYKDAAERFEDLAQEMKAENDIRAEVLAQAGQTWLLAGKAQRARDVLTAALKLDPKSVNLYIDRAQAFAADKLYFDAIDDLNQALELEPERVDALVFRASAYRFADSLELAEENINKALYFDPEHLEALLEKGIILRLQEKNDQARQSWMKLLVLAPGSPAAESARTNLENMDVDKSK